MTLHEVYDLFDYWEAHPPLHEAVAAYLGIKAKPKEVKPLPCTRISPSIGEFPDAMGEMRKKIANDPNFAWQQLGLEKEGVLDSQGFARILG